MDTKDTQDYQMIPGQGNLGKTTGPPPQDLIQHTTDRPVLPGGVCETQTGAEAWGEWDGWLLKVTAITMIH